MKPDEIRAAVVGFIIAGNNEKDIKEWIASNGAIVEDEWQAATRQLKESHFQMTPLSKPFVVEGLREMYRRLVEVGDYSAAAKVLVEFKKVTDK